MPRKKAPIFRALKPAHMQAIGRVAAEWSRLEYVIQLLIAEVASFDSYKCIMLTKQSNIGGWMDMLKNMMTHVYDDPKIDKVLEKLCDKVKSLSADRNAIVHSMWWDNTQGGLPADKASGLGFRRSGKKIAIITNMTAKEMRVVAKNIAVATGDLHMMVKFAGVAHKVRVKNEAEKLATLASGTTTSRQNNLKALSPK